MTIDVEGVYRSLALSSRATAVDHRAGTARGLQRAASSAFPQRARAHCIAAALWEQQGHAPLARLTSTLVLCAGDRAGREEGTDTSVSTHCAILLFGSETWCLGSLGIYTISRVL